MTIITKICDKSGDESSNSSKSDAEEAVLSEMNIFTKLVQIILFLHQYGSMQGY
ncbi:hypothetical protein QMZ30_13610 [Pantoea sp. EA-12]|uniref:hypothetical protein n=1 Tax=Pantoea sp. EA-12 TaxID=3043303 RepID=UPI0024B56F79|nr:hypothetical protein [Pantoea sp. EA-12]MDI9221939.1 hypothetical protein [Pantoea sp. EA-12]